MAWDADGFCDRCQLQLAECRCPGAQTDRKRRQAAKEWPAEPQTRKTTNSPPDMAPEVSNRPVWRGGQSSGDDTADLVPWPTSPNGHSNHAAVMPPLVRFTRMSDVRPIRIKWLWRGYLPLGKVVLLDGDPDLGKSTLCLDLAARMTTGAPWPDGALNEPASVLLISAEDDKAATVRPRLDAAGADSSRVIYLDEIVTEAADGTKVERSPTIPNDLPTLEPMIAEHRPKLIIIDVLMAYLDASVDGYRDQQVRQALIPLARMAERYDCCIIAIRHMTKTVGAKAIYRGGGSIGIIGAARAAFLVAEDSEDSARRVFVCHKMNIAPKPVALEYALEVDDLHGCGRIKWLGQSAHRADDLLNPASDEQRTAADSAASWLRSYLTQEGGEADSKQVKEAGAKAGHSSRTLQRTLQEAGVSSADAETWPRRTIWRLVTDSDNPQGGKPGHPATVAPYSEPGATVAGWGESSQINPRFTVAPSTVAPNGLGATVADTDSDETGKVCAGCGGPLDPHLAAAGFTDHGGDCHDDDRADPYAGGQPNVSPADRADPYAGGWSAGSGGAAVNPSARHQPRRQSRAQRHGKGGRQ
jgi:AAA domain